MPVPPRYWGSVSRYMEVRLFFNSQPETSAFFAFLKGGAAGIIRPSSSPLRGRRRFAPALSRHSCNKKCGSAEPASANPLLTALHA